MSSGTGNCMPNPTQSPEKLGKVKELISKMKTTFSRNKVTSDSKPNFNTKSYDEFLQSRWGKK